MLVCISANPAIDKRVRLAKLVPGRVNRASEVLAAPGGKAAHVAMVLHRLGADPLWVGFAGGANGQELLGGLRELSIRTVSVPMKNATRTNLEIIDEDGAVTELLEPGAEISTEECRALESACEDVFHKAQGRVIAILSGSLPPSVPKNFYANLIEKVVSFGGRAFLDTSGEALKKGLEARPDFVKPNREEAQWLTGRTIQDAHSAAKAIAQIISLGAKSAAVSLGHDGLVWKPTNSDCVFHANSPKVAVRSAVGSGDAAVAGFAYAMERKFGAQDSLKLAAACGTANCLSELPGQLSTTEVQRLRELVKIQVVS